MGNGPNDLSQKLVDQQAKIIELLERKKSNTLEIIAKLSPIVASVLIAIVGWYFTEAYNEQQIRISKLDTVSKFLPGLHDEDDNKQKAALLAIATLGNELLAVRLASLMNTDGAQEALNSLLLESARTGDLALAKILVTAGADVRAADSERRSGLHHAALNDHPGMIEYLAENGSSPDSWSTARELPIQTAIRMGHTESVQALLKAHAQSDRFFDISSQLLFAARHGSVETISLLLRSGAAVDARGRNGETSLILAAAGHKDEIVQVLIEAGASVDAQDDLKATALHNVFRESDYNESGFSSRTWFDSEAERIAREDLKVRVAMKLIEAGASVETPDKEQVTPLMYATSSGRRDLLESMLRRDPNVNAVDSLGRSALVWAVVGGRTAAVSSLIENGANPNIAYRDYASAPGEQLPLNEASERLDGDVIKALIAGGGEVNALNGYGQSALQSALSSYRNEDDSLLEEVVLLLLDSGIKIDQENQYGRLPLNLAVDRENIIILELLLDRGADIDAQNFVDSRTALMDAVEVGSENIVELLIARGARVDIADREGRTALDLAEINENTTIAMMIRQQMN